MKQHNTVAVAHRGTKPQAHKQSLDNQIPQLKRAIRDNLLRAGTLANLGREDAALQRARYAIQQHDRLMELVTKYNENAMLAAKADQQQNPRKAATKTVIKAKRYPRWGEK